MRSGAMPRFSDSNRPVMYTVPDGNGRKLTSVLVVARYTRFDWDPPRRRFDYGLHENVWPRRSKETRGVTTCQEIHKQGYLQRRQLYILKSNTCRRHSVSFHCRGSLTNSPCWCPHYPTKRSRDEVEEEKEKGD